MKFYLFLASTILSLALYRPDPITVLTGQVKDEAGEGLIGVTLKVLQAGTVVRGTLTDYEGNYHLNLEPGTYDMEVLYTGFEAEKITGVQVQENKINRLDVTMKNSTVLQEVVIKQFKVPLIQQDATSTGQTISSCYGFHNLPTRDVNAIVGTSAGKAGKKKNDEVKVRGSRSAAGHDPGGYRQELVGLIEKVKNSPEASLRQKGR
jgi:hypothetical protein